MFTRRDFGRIALTALPLAAGHAAMIDSKVKGVQIGAQSYSFRDRPMEQAIEAFKQVGLGECELWQGHVEPKTTGSGAREELRKWRLETPLTEFANVKKKWNDAGIVLYSYNLSFNDSFTDPEIDRGFEMAKAMGVKVITASSTVTAAKKVAPFADKHKIQVAMHGHDNLKDPNQFAKPESFEAALEMSKYFMINLDIGHFVSAGYDPVDYLQKHHDRIVDLHVKDRNRNHDNLPFGKGETPIKEVLQLLSKNKWKIPANIEYEYKGEDSVAEVRKCYEYMKQALA
ncbi:MAG: Xylose isomerase domain protein barrel [Candidatus Solibacter sp.]|nr:Xylose isomerase domain protein barrel [Candidatus Solibacter sp.]